MKLITICLAVCCLLSTLAPFIASKTWWVRAFDFPHLQITVTNGIVIFLFLFSIDFQNILELGLLVLLFFALLYQLFIIYPYTPFAKKQIVTTTIRSSNASIKVFSANVLQDNKDFERFLSVFRKANPDIAVLLETNNWWQEKLTIFKEEYPYTVEYPLENYYGIILLSKFKLKDMEIKFLIDDEVPSIHGSVQLPNSTWVKLYCLPAPLKMKNL